MSNTTTEAIVTGFQISARVRQAAYAVYALLGVVIGAVQVGFASAELGQPVWLTVSLAVYAFLGTAFGIVAVGNTVAAKPYWDPVDDDDDEVA